MQHNQEMLLKHKWTNVRIIGLAIDDSVPKVKQHVEHRGWGLIEHYCVIGSMAMHDFEVQGVPHCALVDREGLIVWTGHPCERNLEEDLLLLQQGKPIITQPASQIARPNLTPGPTDKILNEFAQKSA
jgi:hypothetical protein